MKSGRIVLVNQSAGYLFIDIANAFAAHYDEVVLLAGDVMPLQRPLHSKVKIRKISSYDRTSTAKRMMSWIYGLVNIWWLLLFRYRGYEVLVCSNPPTASTMLPLLLKRKFTLLIYDIYPDGLVAGNIIKKSNPVFVIWKWLNKRSYKKVHRVLALTNGMALALEQYVSREKLSVIPGWAGIETQAESISENDNEFIKRYSLQGKFLVMYSGNLGKEYQVEVVVQLAEKFKDNPDIMFVISGRGWKMELLRDMITKMDLKNCMLLPSQPPSLFLAFLSAAHVGVVSLADSAAKVAIPSKTYNLLAAHKPILCIGSEESDLARLLSDSGAGISLSPEYLDKMKMFIEKLYSDKRYFERICRNAALASGQFTHERALDIVRLTKS